jgi:hypothetical protein
VAIVLIPSSVRPRQQLRLTEVSTRPSIMVCKASSVSKGSETSSVGDVPEALLGDAIRAFRLKTKLKTDGATKRIRSCCIKGPRVSRRQTGTVCQSGRPSELQPGELLLRALRAVAAMITALINAVLAAFSSAR